MHRLFRLSPVFLFLVFPAPRLWCQSLTIQEIEWTDSVSANRLATTTYGKKASVNSLVIWIKTRCDSSAYAKLRQAKKLPVSFHWYYKPEGGSWLPADPMKMEPEDTFEESNAMLLNELSAKLKKDGYIEWTSWTTRKGLVKGHWRVAVLSGGQQLKESKKIRIE